MKIGFCKTLIDPEIEAIFFILLGLCVVIRCWYETLYVPNVLGQEEYIETRTLVVLIAR